MFKELVEEYLTLQDQLKEAQTASLQAAQREVPLRDQLTKVWTQLGAQIKNLGQNEINPRTGRAILFEHKGKQYSMETNLVGGQIFLHELLSPEEADKVLMMKKLKGE